MFTLRADNAPSLLIPNETSTGFKLFTISTPNLIQYRITMEANTTLSNYDFLIDLRDQKQGNIVSFDIPFKRTNFTNIKAPQPTPSLLIEKSSSEIFDGELFKLINITTESEIPAEINFKATYYIGNSQKLRFVYYRIIEGNPYFTGYYGNLFLHDVIYPPLKIDTSQIYSIIMEGDIQYLIFKITNTPNIIFGQTTGTTITDTYSDEKYFYTLMALGNSLQGNSFFVNMTIKNSEEQYIIPTEQVKIQPAGILQILNTQLFGTYTLNLQLKPLLGTNTINFRLYF